MANLFDALQQHLGQMPTAPAPQQAQIQAGLAAKSGKAAVGGSAPKASNVGETAAIGQAQAEGQQIALQGATANNEIQNQTAALDQQNATFQAGQQAQARTAAHGLATQNATTRDQISTQTGNALDKTAASEATSVAQINANADQKLKTLANERGVSINDIFADFKASNEELEFRKDAAQLEQAGFLMAMRDKSYVAEIERVGQERGLQDEIAFSEEATRLTLGNNLSDLLEKTGFQAAFNQDARTFQTSLANIDINAAIQLANAAIADENNKAVIQGTTGLAKAGATEYFAPSKSATIKVDQAPTSEAEDHNLYESQVGDGMLS